MKIKGRYLAFIIMCVVLMMHLTSFSVSAEQGIYVVSDNTEQLSTTVNDDGLTVFGYFGEKSGYPVTITVKNAVDGAIVCLEQVMTTERGYYCVLFPYDAEMLGQTYKVSVRSITDQMLYEKTLNYQPGTNKEVITGLLSGVSTTNEMEDLLWQYGTDIGIFGTELNSLDNPENVYSDLIGKDYLSLEDFQVAFKNALDEQKQVNASVHEVHLAPNGNNTNSGSADSPLATLECALKYIEFLMENGSEDNFEILLHGGEYSISSDIVIQKNQYKNHITIRNYNDEKPILNGSKEINNWESYQGNIYRAKIETGLNINVLFENKNMLIKARYPNKAASNAELFDEYLSAVSYNDSSTQFMYNEGDLPDIENTHDLEAVIFSGGSGGTYMWGMNIIKLASFQPESNLISLSSEALYTIGTGSKYYMQGAVEFIDTPGEFYYDNKTGYIYYYPTDGVIEGKVVSYPVVNNMLTIQNKNGKNISDITIDGLTICCTDRNSRVDIFGNNSGGNGIYINNAKNINIKNCEIYSVGGNAIAVEGNLQNSIFSGNYLYNNGMGGVTVTGTEFDVTKNNKIENNYICRQTLIVHSSAGITLNSYNADGNVISHNCLHDFKRSGITLNYAEGNNIIEYNDISNGCNGSDDSGMVYISQTTGETTIRNNYIHDADSVGGYMGIYADEGSDNTIIEKNLITRLYGNCSNAILAKGDDIHITNNYLIDCPDIVGAAIASSMKFDTTERMVIERNLIYNCSTMIFSHSSVSDSTQRLASSDYNAYYNAQGEYTFRHRNSTTSIYDFDEYRELGYEQNSIVQDPQFISNKNGDVRLSYASPALSIGIEPLELGKMGLRSDFVYGDTSDSVLKTLFVKRNDDAVNGGFVEINVGESISLDVLVRNENGFTVSEEDYTIGFVTEPNDFVTISDDGVVTGLKTGVVRITANAQMENSDVCAEFDVVILEKTSENSALRIQGLVVKNQAGKNLTEIESGKLSVELTVSSDVETTAKLSVSYEDESKRLLAVGTSDNINLMIDNPTPIKVYIDIPSNNKGSLRAFVWESFDTLKPLCPYIPILTDLR